MQNTVVRILSVKERAKYWNMYLYLKTSLILIILSYTVFTFIITSLFGPKYQIVCIKFVMVICCPGTHLFLNNFIRYCFFAFICPIQIISASSRSLSFSHFNHLTLSCVCSPASFFHWKCLQHSPE